MTTSPDSTISTTGGRWLYPLLLAMQTIGAVLIYWKGLPLYRLLVADPAAYATREETLDWSLSASVLIQVGYWICYRVRPSLPGFVNPLLGHIVQFSAGLIFTLATTVFGFVFITKKLGSQMPATRYLLTLTVLFSLFCYMQELKRLGTALLGREKKPKTQP